MVKDGYLTSLENGDNDIAHMEGSGRVVERILWESTRIRVIQIHDCSGKYTYASVASIILFDC